MTLKTDQLNLAFKPKLLNRNSFIFMNSILLLLLFIHSVVLHNLPGMARSLVARYVWWDPTPQVAVQ